MYLHNLVLLAEYLVYILGLLRFLIKLLHLYALLYSFSFVIISFSIYIFFCCILNYVLCNCIDCYSRQVFKFYFEEFWNMSERDGFSFLLDFFRAFLLARRFSFDLIQFRLVDIFLVLFFLLIEIMIVF